MTTPADRADAARRTGATTGGRGRAATRSFDAAYGTRTTTPSQVVNVRLSEDLLARAATYGNAHALNLSETVRSLIERGLDAEDPTTPEEAPAP